MPQPGLLTPTDALSHYQAELSRLRSIGAERFAEEKPPAEPLLVTFRVVPKVEKT